jgi:hypothetical protein
MGQVRKNARRAADLVGQGDLLLAGIGRPERSICAGVGVG